MNHIHERETIKTKKFIKKKTVERTWCVYCEKEKTQEEERERHYDYFLRLKGQVHKTEEPYLCCFEGQ